METATESKPKPGPNLEVGDKPGLKCIYGCDIADNQEIFTLLCLHFVCSDACAEKLKAETKSGKVKCKECNSTLTRALPAVKILAANVFGNPKPEVGEVELICDHCVWNRPAIGYCAECPTCLCQQCKDLHPQVRLTSSHHVSDDLSQPKAERLKQILETETKCGPHKLNFICYCAICDTKLCQKCEPEHEGHEKYNIEVYKQTLQSSIKQSRKLTDKLDRAMLDIKNKREELLDKEWNNITTSINDSFETIIEVIARSKNKLMHEAKVRFVKQVAALQMRSRCAQFAKASTERFSKVGSDVLELEDVAPIKFLRHFRGYTEWLTDLEKKLNAYNMFVDKDYHFKLNTAGIEAVEKFFEEHFEFEYSLTSKPGDNAVTPKSHSQVRKTTLASPANVSGVIRQGEQAKTPSRRIAVKSTGAPQLDANKRNILKSYHRPSLGVSSASVFTIEKPKNKTRVHSRHADAETEAEKDSEKNSRTSSNPQLPARENNQDDEVEVDMDDVHSAITIRLSNGEDVKEERDTELASCTSDDSSVEKPNLRTSTISRRRVSNDQETPHHSVRTRRNSVGPPSVSTSSGETEATATTKSSDTDNINDNNRPSPESSESSELGIGKRERKKKSYPEFVAHEDSLKLAKKPSTEEPTTPGRSKRKSVTTTPNNAKHPRISIRARIKDEESGQDNSYAEDAENGIENGSSDGNLSDTTTTRRHSQRSKSVLGTPLKTEIENYPEAPETSIETAPEVCDYPVMGQGRMKISNDDENEDYCSICMDGGEDIIVCCDYCPKVFHQNCHIPVITMPEGEAKWQCNYDTTKKDLEVSLASCPQVEGSENMLLDEATNQYHFLYACKFLMEVYKIREVPTIRWFFPDGYKKEFGKVPYHLKYVRERLCLGSPEPFVGVKDMLLALRQVFKQAFLFYAKKKLKLRTCLVTCWQSFLRLLDEYYPQFKDIFTDVDSNIL